MPKPKQLADRFNEIWATIPNLVDDTAADGLTDADNQEIKRVGTPPAFDFAPLDFTTIGSSLDLVDMDRGAKVSGSRFGYLKGQAVLLEFALVRYAFDHLLDKGFTPMVPPVLVREQALYGTGFFPADREQVYAVPADDLYLVGTSEVPLAAYHADEILESLPVRYAGFSTCFRREAGSYGRDTQGLFRVHQFDKVEMFVFTRAEDSRDEHDRLLAIEEDDRHWPGAAVPGGQRGRRGSRGFGGEEVRYRGVVPLPAGLSRDHLVLEHHRLSGSTPEGPLPDREAATSWSTRSTGPRWRWAE